MLELQTLHVVERDHPHRPRRRPLLVVGADPDPRVGDRAHVAHEVAGRALRLAPRPGRGQLGEPREAEQALGGLRLGGEEALTAQPDPLDEAAHEDVGAPILHHRRCCAVELQEVLEVLAGIGWDLRALQRRLGGGDHVELAAARDRRQPRQVYRAKLHRRPGQRPGSGGRVVGIG